jgi:hypothetical protein
MRFLGRRLTGAALLAALLPAQRPAGDAHEDPYTRNDPELLAAAGYVSLGPLHFAGRQDTPQIDHVLGEDVRMVWIETAHFQIGCALVPYPIARQEWDEKGKIHAELARLKTKLPRVDAKAPRLDRWLRAHLFAQRAEELYADLAQRLGAHEAPPGPGPYLGQSGKYAILLVDKASTFGTYWRTYVGNDPGTPLRYNFPDEGCLFYGGATEHSQGEHRTDTAAHCHLVFNLVHNLLDGYRSYTHALPIWWSDGLAHWYVRRINPRFVLTSDPRVYDIDPKRAWTWATRVRQRVKFDHFPPADELLRWDDPTRLSFIDHMMVWSRVDYVLSLGDGGVRRYMDLMKGPIAGANVIPTRTQVFERQERALREAWELDAAAFDEHWKKYVLTEYRQRKD